MLLTAYYAGDRETLKKFMDAEVLSTFVKNIEDRGNDGLTVSFQFVYVSSVEIVDVNLFEGNAYLEITVKFVADVVLSVKDQNGELVSGDPEKIKKIKDVWTFGRDLRSESPNWMVVETGE
jgi:predicted lipid-binding transport protein (Tim44 family)